MITYKIVLNRVAIATVVASTLFGAALTAEVTDITATNKVATKAPVSTRLNARALNSNHFQFSMLGTGSEKTKSYRVKSGQLKKLKTRLCQVNSDILKRGILSVPGKTNKFLTGYSYGTLYDWDLYFENLYLSHYGVSEYCFTNLKLFLDAQDTDGYVRRQYDDEKREFGCFKPFLAQLAVLGSRQKGDFTWLKQGGYYEKLIRHINWYFDHSDGDKNGLPVWQSAGQTGMDNQYKRSGNYAGGNSSNFDEGVDLACYLYRELQALAVIAGELGKADEQQWFLQRSVTLKTKMNETFWDEKDGFYYDRNERTGKQIRIKTAVGFLPLWAGIASNKQAVRLVNEHLLNPKEFWLPYPVASYAMTEPEFRLGGTPPNTCCNWLGTTWIPTNYMIFHGLKQYGYAKEAQALAQKTFDMVLENNGTTREYYNGNDGSGNGLNPFWGWSTLGYVMLFENKANYNPMDLHDPIKPMLSNQLDIPFPPTVVK